jgi:hypothetical protein
VAEFVTRKEGTAGSQSRGTSPGERWNSVVLIGANLEIEERKQRSSTSQERAAWAHGQLGFGPCGFLPTGRTNFSTCMGLIGEEGPSLEVTWQSSIRDREFMRSLINRMFAEASGCDVTSGSRPDSEVRCTLRCCSYCRERGPEKDCRHRNGCD